MGGALMGCAGRQTPLARYEYAQVHMGVQVRLVVYAPTELAAKEACTAAYEKVADLDQVMSDYRPDSDLMRLCATGYHRPQRVSGDLFYVLQFAQRVSEKSKGAFDVTVGPLVALWRTARRTGALPPAAELERARTKVGWRLLRLDAEQQTVELLAEGMRLDLGGIAKGYAGDVAMRVLKAHGVDCALFEAGGDIVVSASPPGTRGWGIKIDEGLAAPRLIHLSNAAISTSGGSAQFVEINGQRYSHVIDPRTGLGLTRHTAATVIAPDGITSDSLSTAACVLGRQGGMELVGSFKGAKGYVREVRDARP
jgi:thiamine biosynthesis lipoprotein